MEFGILGPLDVVGGTRIISLPRGRGRALLALLILNAGRVVSTDRLVDELWGQQPPATAATALQGLVSKLRKRLEPTQTPTVLITREPGYVLAVDPDQVDAHRFRRLVEEAAIASPADKAALLRTALALWRGPALADFTYQPFAQIEITALEELRLSATEDRIDADLELGHHGRVVAELETLVADHSLRERLHGQLMVALYREGRQAEALDVYRRLHRNLVEELGIDPNPSLQRLEAAILRQEPSLDLPAQPAQPDIAERPWLPPGRKTITVVFVDLAPIDHAPSWDPETRQRLIGRGYQTATAALTSHGGTVEGLIGDVVVAVFGVPVAHEDDAVRAVRAATELRRQLVELNDELQDRWGTRLAARVGIDTGEVVVGRLGVGGPPASGDVVNVAARLQQAARPEEVLLGEGTRRLVGEAALVDSVESPVAEVRTWRLTALAPSAPLGPSGDEAPIVDRGAELARLRAVFDSTVRSRHAALVMVLGEAGVGKSRLVREFASAAEPEALVLAGHCPAYGEGITFWPLREVVGQALHRRKADNIAELFPSEEGHEFVAAQVAEAVGLTDRPGKPQALFPAVRSLVEALARTKPLVVVLEDVHWAQPTLLDLIDYLAESVEQPVVLACLARPDFFDQHRPWTGEVTSLVLEPLGSDDSKQLMADRLAGRAMSPATLTRVLEISQGNPLFLEQIVAALRDDGEVSIPPAVEALLTARIDRLGPAERDLLRCASVAGMDFTYEAVAALVPTEGRPFLSRHLQTLQDKELIRSTDQDSSGGPAFAFRHVLIQRAAYRSITRQVRSELHERIGRWLEKEAGSPSSDEMVGYHLERACLDRRSLGLTDDHTRALAVDAGERLADAGARAFARFDAAAAENLLSRATALLPSTHPHRAQARGRLAEAYTVMGRHHDADAVLAELQNQAELNPARERFVRIERARIRLATGPDPTRLGTIRDEANQVLDASKQDGDEAASAQALFLLTLIHLRLGQVKEMEELARRSIAPADRSGSAREELGSRLVLALALEAGPTPVPECIAELEQLSRWRGTEHPSLLSTLAHLRAMVGEFDLARELIARSRRLLMEQTRARRPLGLLSEQAAQVEILAGDWATAERHLRAGLDLNLAMGERDRVSVIAAILSGILTRRGEVEEAARLASAAERHAPIESVTAQARWRAARARAETKHDPGKAAELARRAVGLVTPDMLNLGADLRLDLAEILLADRRGEVARSLAREAAGLYGRKGNLVGVVRAQALPA